MSKDIFPDWKSFKVRPSVAVAPTMFFSVEVGGELGLDGTIYTITSKIVDQTTDGTVTYKLSLEEVVEPYWMGRMYRFSGDLTPKEQRDLNRKTRKGSGKTIDDSELNRLSTPLDLSSFSEESS